MNRRTHAAPMTHRTRIAALVRLIAVSVLAMWFGMQSAGAQSASNELTSNEFADNESTRKESTHSESVRDKAAWAALQSGAHVVLMRHAETVPGIGDPEGFQLDDCSTQRNLSAQGRADARAIGEAFRTRAVPVDAVLSSRWCRCIDTAQIAFGRVTPAPILDSMFTEPRRAREDKARQVFAFAARHRGAGNLVFVTHDVNIQELAGVSVAQGEMLIVKLDGTSRFKQVGRLRISPH